MMDRRCEIRKIAKLFCDIKTNTVLGNNVAFRYDIIRNSVNHIIKKINELIDAVHNLEEEVEELRKERNNDDQ